MTRPLGPVRYGVLALAALMAGWAMLFFMPTSAYQRYQSLQYTDYIKGLWIYERLNFDPTPVDIAFLGSSRTMEGIDAAAIEADLHKAGIAAHVVNLAVPSLGLDVPYLLGRMLVETKRPRIVFLETDYLVTRMTNPVFPLVATAEDVLRAPLLVNERLLPNLLSVAARNLTLAWRHLTQGEPEFDPSGYYGPHWEDVYRVIGHNGTKGRPRLAHMDQAQFEAEAARWRGNVLRKSQQYDSWAWLELHYAEAYQMRLVALLRESGAKIVFLSMPAVGTPEPPFHDAELRQYGSFWPLPDVVSRDYTLWDNPTHMNYRGAELYSAWLAQQLRSGQGRLLEAIPAASNDP